MTKTRLRQSRSPIAGLGRDGKRALSVLAVVAAMNAAGFVLVAEALARAISGVFAGAAFDLGFLWLGLAGVVLRAGATWANRIYSARAVTASKIEIRRGLAQRALRGSDNSTGALGTLGTRGVDDLDEYFTTFLPALVSALIIPFVLIVRILFADWLSALIIVLTIPLVPLFMILIGFVTRDAVDQAQDSLLRLSGHLVELARGLPVLVGLGRVRDQVGALERLSDEYRQRTMRTLRTVFMSSLAMELISTISMAVIAVFIGVRLVYGGLDLEVGLLVLILAPDCYAPFRQAGSAYHSAEDGVAALDRVQAVRESPLPEPLWDAAESTTAAGVPQAVSATDFRVAFLGRAPLFEHLAFTAPAGTMTLLDGASGTGKTTILAALAGKLGSTEPGEPSPLVSGNITGIDPQRLAWVPQHPHAFGESVLDELVLHARLVGTTDPGSTTQEARLAAKRMLDELGLSATVTDPETTPPHALSPGELRRLAIARALLRIDAGATTALLDEPTAHLDGHSADLVRAAIARRRGKATMILASHAPIVHAMCDHRIPLTRAAAEGTMRLEMDTSSEPDKLGAAAHDHAPVLGELETDGDSGQRPDALEDGTVGQSPRASLWQLFRLLKPAGWAFALGTLLAVAAVIFGITQTSISGWLIVRAAEQPPILLLMVAIVGVRFFGIGRSVLRYLERLQIHDAVFRLAGQLRRRLWDALASTALRFKRLRTGPAALDLLVREVDAIRDELPRVVLPQLVSAATLAALVIAAAIWLPEAVAPVLLLAIVALLLAPALIRLADRRLTSDEEHARARLSQRFTALVEAGPEIAVHRVETAPLRELAELEVEAMRLSCRSAWVRGAAHGLIVAATISAVLWLTATAWSPGGVTPSTDAKLLTAFALGMLALIEPMTDGVTAVQRWPRLQLLLDSVQRVLGVSVADEAGDSSEEALEPNPVSSYSAPNQSQPALVLAAVTGQWPEQSAAVFEQLSVTVERGQWLTVTGPSGSGKSTLLATVMGHLPPRGGQVLIHGQRVLADTAGHIAWCPQESHLFNSTLRGNLVLARPSADRPTDQELESTLQLVGLGEFFDSLADGLDTRIGADGSWLSGGQRQRVAIARTLLTKAPVVLLDEPTAHLDEEAAQSLMRDLRIALADRAVVCVTHRLTEQQPGDIQLQLPMSGAASDAELVGLGVAVARG
ncbi:thiol reductant ABC exporter subunit CydC [Gulosibacter chungangensis]|nr:thiol reductant ABC exporter subunit CydC [Gulosibacter chungangensis]